MKKLLTLTLALALLLTGCGVPSAPAETPEAATVSTVVRTEVVYPLPAPAELVGLARVGDTLIVAGDDGGAPVLGMADWSLDGAPALGETRLLDAGTAAICGVAAGEDCFYVLTGEEPASRLNASREIVRNEDYQGRYCVLKYAADGALLGQMTLRDWRAGEMLGIAAGPDGELLLYACQTAALLRSVRRRSSQRMRTVSRRTTTPSAATRRRSSARTPAPRWMPSSTARPPPSAMPTPLSAPPLPPPRRAFSPATRPRKKPPRSSSRARVCIWRRNMGNKRKSRTALMARGGMLSFSHAAVRNRRSRVAIWARVVGSPGARRSAPSCSMPSTRPVALAHSSAGTA